jgi:hypothetical protein
MAHPKQLARINRVRTVQLTLARAAQAQAQAQAASESALTARIARLADAISPAALAGPGVSLIAAAHYRDRLQQSAFVAQGRVVQAEQRAAAASDATRAAERDLKAVEKLQERADADAVIAAIRAMEGAPMPTRALRHDPC